MAERVATILVVDDAPEQVLILDDLLSEHYAVQTASNGAEALDYLETGGGVDLILTDAMMPGVDGFELCSRLKEMPRLRDCPVIFLTTLESADDEQRALSLGAADLIHKPVSPPVVMARVRNHLELARVQHVLRERNAVLELAHNKAKESLRLERAALEASEEKFRLMVEGLWAEYFFFRHGREGVLTYVSPSVTDMLGLAVEEARTNFHAYLTDSPSNAGVAEVVAATIRGVAQPPFECEVSHKDGSTRQLEVLEVPVFGVDGQVADVFGLAHDITTRKEAERQRAMMEIQLRQAQKLESIGQLAAGIAHEINTPTQYIGDNVRFLQDAFTDLREVNRRFRQLLEAARQGAVSDEAVREVEDQMEEADMEYLMEEIPRAIAHTLEGIERVTKIVRATKNFSHPGSEEKTPIDLNKAIESTLTVSRNEWKYHADLVTDFYPALPLVPCLPGEFNQVILNLIINAAHAIADVVGDGSNGKGTLTVRTRHDGTWAEIRIEDTGGGIPEQVRERIFDPFFTTKVVGKGTGQGLAICRSVIVDQHGGTIHFDTKLGRGTSFVVRLPMEPAADGAGGSGA
jgi:PAS domain S-box-containing protein